MRRPCFALWLLILLLLAARGEAIEVRDTLWSFDARVVPGRMNFVSVRVANPSKQPFDGMLKLTQPDGVNSSRGVPYLQPVYLAPGAERWVQFSVFISGYDQFSLTSEGGRPQQLPAPENGPPARVILTDETAVFAPRAQVRQFSDALFPTTVAALDGLDAVALDYVPRWEPARREALLDWLRRGGSVLVLRGADGQFPRFADQLAPLNVEDSARIGAGRVVRVARTRGELTPQTFVEAFGPAPELQGSRPVTIYSLEGSLFNRLAALSRPEIRWGLINTLSLLYLVLIGPVSYFTARRLDYRLALAGFLACVALFAGAFSVVGRRGAGEAQTVHSLSLARAIEPGRHDVTQWLSAFATRGAEYRLTHPAAANLYGTVNSEAIRGAILNGRDGGYLADIPLFSSRQFIHRAAMAGADTSVTVQRWEETGDTLKALVLRTAPGFPAEPVELQVRFRDQFYRLEKNGPDLVLAADVEALTFEKFLPTNRLQMESVRRPDTVAGEADKELPALLPLLYARALDGRDHIAQAIVRGPQPAGQLQLFVFAASPEGFRLQGEGFQRELGYTLYVQDVFKP